MPPKWPESVRKLGRRSADGENGITFRNEAQGKMSETNAYNIGPCYVCHTPIGYRVGSDRLVHFVDDAGDHNPSLAADPETAAKNVAEAMARLGWSPDVADLHDAEPCASCHHPRIRHTYGTGGPCVHGWTLGSIARFHDPAVECPCSKFVEPSHERVLEQMRQDSLNVHEDDDSGAMWRAKGLTTR